MMGRYEQGAADPAVVTAADMVAGHVTLDISCLDRLYLNGYVAKLQTPGGVVYFFRDHRGKPIVSPALFEPIGEKFRKDIKDWAQANGVPVIRFRARERKADVMAPYLDAAAAAGRSQVVAIGCAPSTSSPLTTSPGPASPPQPDIPSRPAAHGQAALQPARKTSRAITRCHTQDHRQRRGTEGALAASCDKVSAIGARPRGSVISVNQFPSLVKPMPSAWAGARHVLVAVEDHLGAGRRVPGHILTTRCPQAGSMGRIAGLPVSPVIERGTGSPVSIAGSAALHLRAAAAARLPSPPIRILAVTNPSPCSAGPPLAERAVRARHAGTRTTARARWSSPSAPPAHQLGQ